MQEFILNPQRSVRLSVCLQDNIPQGCKRPAVLVLPGGGYMNLSEHEADPIAYPYMAAGYHAFVLRYSIDTHRAWPNPLEDYEQAMEFIRDHGDAWHILTDKIAVVGFSAGGHLAACAATVARNRPNAAILGYAPTQFDLIQAIQPEGAVTIGPVDFVDENTCPCFLFTARDDALVPVMNTLDFEAALARSGVAFESHIYAYGGHGFGTASAQYARPELCRRVPNWIRDSIGWLEDVFGALTPTGTAEPACPIRLNDNKEPFLSIRCTFDHLKNHASAGVIYRDLLETLETIGGKMCKGRDMFLLLYGNTQIRELLAMAGYSAEQLDALNDELMKIPNA